MKRLGVHRLNFLLLWSGQFVSQLGDSIFHVALVWYALRLPEAKWVSGLILAMGYLPPLLFSLPVGAMVDRLDRKSILITCAALQALVVGMVPLADRFGALTPATLMVFAFLLSSGTSFAIPARDSLIPWLVTAEQMHQANSYVRISSQMAFMAGPLVASLATAQLGLIHLFSIDSVTFGLNACFLWLVWVPLRPRNPTRRDPRSLPARDKGTWADIREGLHHAWEDRRLRGLMLLTALNNLVIMGPAMLGMPVFVREVLGLGEAGVKTYTWLLSTCFAGMMLSSVLIGMLGRGLPKGKLIVWGSILDALTILPFFYIRALPALFLAMFLHGLTVPLISVPRVTLIQEIVPDDRRGRMFSLLNLAVIGFTALSMILTGVLSEVWHMDRIFLIAGILGTLGGLLGMGCRELWKTR